MAGEQILLVDDDPDLLALHTRFLTGQGYRVAPAANGAQALQALEHQGEFHLAILDLMLPDVSGLELLSLLKKRSPATEVIMFTGYGGLDSALAALRLGAYDYLVKTDLRLPDLQAVLNRALERRGLAQANRQLLENLQQAQAELARQRANELTLIRRIGETLARPRTLDDLATGLLDLVREGLPAQALGFTLKGPDGETVWEGYRHPDHLPAAGGQAFQEWLQGGLVDAAGKGDACPLNKRPIPYQAVMWERIAAAPLTGAVAVARDEAFSPEEVELFRIFALQGEAALTNLLLLEEVKGLAIRDDLTGLYNFRYFWEMLNHHVELSRRYGEPLSLLFLDLDDFKRVNDTYGHLQGDLVLRAVGAFLRQAVRQADLACRYGGEEYAVILPQTPAAAAMGLGERLRAGVAATLISCGKQELSITVSVGVGAFSPRMDGAALVAQADQALYQAKQGGKNRVVGAPPAQA
jgi:diguanylate cyclase (GGDEF)-like protein